MATLIVTPSEIVWYAIAALTRHQVQESLPQAYKPALSQDNITQAFLKYDALLSPQVKEKLNGRLERGLAMARSDSVLPQSDQSLPGYLNQFWVNSSQPYKPAYFVDIQQRTGKCPDCFKGNLCKHIIAASIISLAIQAIPPKSVPTPIPTPVATHVAEASPVTKPAPTVQASPPPPSITADIPQDSIVWGVIRHNGNILGVEVLCIKGEDVTIRALPKVTKGNKLQPQFPFDG